MNNTDKEKQPVTIICAECGETKTELRAPGPVPKYCLTCTPLVYRRMNAERMRRYRAKKRAEG